MWVCYNWVHAFGGDRKAYEEANPHLDPKDLQDWTHEFWECSGCQETDHKVRNRIPYWLLCYLYGVIDGYRKWYQVRKRYL